MISLHPYSLPMLCPPETSLFFFFNPTKVLFSQPAFLLAHLLTHGDGLLLCLQDCLLEYSSPFLDFFALQDCLPRDSTSLLSRPKSALWKSRMAVLTEVIFYMFQEPPILFPLCCVIFQQVSGKLKLPLTLPGTRASDCEMSPSCL